MADGINVGSHPGGRRSVEREPGPDRIRRAREGDRGAFEEIVEAHRGLLESTLRARLGKRLGGTVEVADLLQETLCQAFDGIGRFRGNSGAALRNWLLTIARHVVETQGRRLGAKKRILTHEVLLSRLDRNGTGRLWDLLVASGPSPSGTLRRKERFERLQAAFGCLDPDHRTVVQLAILKGLPLKEVGRLMDRSPKAASVLLWRAMVKLRKAFGNTGSFSLPPRNLEG